MAKYTAFISKVEPLKDAPEYDGETEVLVEGSFKTFKELELALERGLKASVIPRKKKAKK